jgi:hypothetical protein
MSQKKLVGEIVDYYYKVEAVKEQMEINGRVGSDEIVMMSDLLIDLDRVLTNVSKRWAKGNRAPKPLIRPIE